LGAVINGTSIGGYLVIFHRGPILAVVATAAFSGSESLQATMDLAQKQDLRLQSPGDCVRFVEDLNVPDGTQEAPGQTFDKVWRLHNCGATTWTGYQAVRVDGNYGPEAIAVPTGAVDQDVDVRAPFTAPSSQGRHRATYRLQGPGGMFGAPFWVEIVVGGGGGGNGP